MRAFRLLCGDARELAAGLAAASFDACLCDPPYHLTARGGGGPHGRGLSTPHARARAGAARGGFMNQTWDGGDVAQRPETWAALAAAMKPGAPLLAFGGTRTFHRLTCAIEDAGLEIRDCLCWLYGSGFPKSLDISKAIDKAAGAEREHVADRPAHTASAKWREAEGRSDRLKPSPVTAPLSPDGIRWSGYGTALKPAWEPIVLAMKPLDDTFAANALAYGVAGLNVDGCRIGLGSGEDVEKLNARSGGRRGFADEYVGGTDRPLPAGCNLSAGRWPANLVLDETAAATLDEQSGELVSGTAVGGLHRRSNKTANCYGEFVGQRTEGDVCFGDTGGASRFFYCAKADTAERAGSKHPTLKPVDLCAWLAKLILPPPRADGQPRRLLVPFAGAGSEMIGALRAGWDEVVGIEVSEEYVEDARRRISGDAPLLNVEMAA